MGSPMTHADELERAIVCAVTQHEGQRDKQGLPVILHVLRVMLACRGGSAQIVAALHDIVEDTKVELTDLAMEGFSPCVVAAVEAITRRESETYTRYIHRLATNMLAREVKIADLRDNLARGGAFPSLCQRYRGALAYLDAPDSLAGASVPVERARAPGTPERTE